MSAMSSQAPGSSYLLGRESAPILNAGILLLQKLLASTILRPAEIVSAAKALHVLQRLPQVSEEMTLSVMLKGPRRWFGDENPREIFHWWEISIDGFEIRIMAGGHFYRESTGGDSFTGMTWDAQPGCEPDYVDYSPDLSLVDDAQPFPDEIACLDFSEPGYAVEIQDESNALLGEMENQTDEDSESQTEDALDQDQQPEGTFQIDVGQEADRYFDDSSKSNAGTPKLVLVMGGVAAGKTTLRKAKFSNGFVLVDAGDIFIRLSRGGYFDFPGHLEAPMHAVGALVAARAVKERRNIVTEIIGSDSGRTLTLIETMKAAGYKVESHGVTCEISVAMERNKNRSDDNISAYFSEPFNERWLIEAARAI
jgi:hypothetical protein